MVETKVYWLISRFKISSIIVDGITGLVFRRDDLSAGCRKAYVKGAQVQEGLNCRSSIQ